MRQSAIQKDADLGKPRLSWVAGQMPKCHSQKSCQDTRGTLKMHPFFDHEAITFQFANATAKGSEQLQEAVYEATLKALQGREMTLEHVQSALQAVSQAVNQGVSKNAAPKVDVQALLQRAASGMDQALLKVVQAHHTALSQLVSQGADLRESHLQRALDELKSFEDAFFNSLKHLAQSGDTPTAGAWGDLLSRMRTSGTACGTQAQTTVTQMIDQAHQSVVATRMAGLHATQALMEGYAAMVNGVLLGMSQALSGATRPPSNKQGS